MPALISESGVQQNTPIISNLSRSANRLMRGMTEGTTQLCDQPLWMALMNV